MVAECFVSRSKIGR